MNRLEVERGQDGIFMLTQEEAEAKKKFPLADVAARSVKEIMDEREGKRSPRAYTMAERIIIDKVKGLCAQCTPHMPRSSYNYLMTHYSWGILAMIGENPDVTNKLRDALKIVTHVDHIGQRNRR